MFNEEERWDKLKEQYDKLCHWNHKVFLSNIIFKKNP